MKSNLTDAPTALFIVLVSVICISTPVEHASGAENEQPLSTQLQKIPLNSLADSAISLGDQERGKSIFHREKLGCVKCHVATPEETAKGLRSIGPDQRNVGDRLNSKQLVKAVLYPNETIAKGYESYAVVSSDGKVHKGILISQTDEEVTLADPEKKGLTKISQDDIEEMQQAGSAMPADLVNQLADKQEFYDLIKYLSEQKASKTGTPVVATDSILVKEVEAGEGQLPLLAVARPDGICYCYDPNQFHFASIWTGPLGWEQPDGQFTLNQSSAQLFYIRENPWKIDVNQVLFDFQWLGYETSESGLVLRYSLTEILKDKKADQAKTLPRQWTVQETIEISSLFRQRLKFTIKHPEASAEILTYWIRQTNFRNVGSNGQQAQRNQLLFLKPGQTEYTVDLSRRRTEPTMPTGYSVSRVDGPEIAAPYLFEPTGFSFADDGTAFASTRAGGIWRYKDQRWNQFADGLQETQGVQVASNGRDVYTMQKPELTLLRDTDGDGQADLYSSVANQFRFTGQPHQFSFGPVINSSGELFFSTGLSSWGGHEVKESGSGQMGSPLGYRGWVMKVDANGELHPFAGGVRSPAGIGMNANDDLFITDNQGDWVASSYLGHVEEGDFLGHPAALWDREEYGITPRQLDYTTVETVVESVPELDEENFAAQRKRPAVWLIHGDLTNSPGNPSFCPPTGFGPFEGQAFIADISHRTIVRAALEKVNGVYQGAVFPFIRPLESASFSTCFDPQGRLWVGSVGRGWTVGDPIIEVISFDETKPPFEMHRIELKPNGFDVHFTQPIQAADLASDQITVRQFHYLYWAEYGSDRQDVVEQSINNIAISPDRRTISIQVPISKDKIYEIDLGTLESASGIELKNNFAFYTINELAK